MSLNNINSILCKGNDLMADSLSVLSLNHQHLLFVIDGLSSCSQPQKATNLCKKILENKFYNQEILDDCKKTSKLSIRYKRAKNRYRENWKKECRGITESAKLVMEKIDSIVSDQWLHKKDTLMDQFQQAYSKIENSAQDIDILLLDSETRNRVIEHFESSRIFVNSYSESDLEYISEGFRGMRQLIL